MIMQTTIKIAVVDDEMLFRKSLLLLLNREENFHIVFDGENGKDLIDYLETSGNHPDIILLDIRMSVLNGIETSKIISEKFPDIKIVILSSLESERLVEQMICYGASAYLIKKSHPEMVIRTINQVYRTGIYFDSKMMNIIVNMKRINNNKSKGLFCELSNREIEILNLMCQQFNTKEIAEQLCLSERTVDGHRKRMLEKTNSKNSIGLILWGIKNQILMIE